MSRDPPVQPPLHACRNSRHADKTIIFSEHEVFKVVVTILKKNFKNIKNILKINTCLFFYYTQRSVFNAIIKQTCNRLILKTNSRRRPCSLPSEVFFVFFLKKVLKFTKSCHRQPDVIVVTKFSLAARGRRTSLAIRDVQL